MVCTVYMMIICCLVCGDVKPFVAPEYCCTPPTGLCIRGRYACCLEAMIFEVLRLTFHFEFPAQLTRGKYPQQQVSSPLPPDIRIRYKHENIYLVRIVSRFSCSSCIADWVQHPAHMQHCSWISNQFLMEFSSTRLALSV